MASRNWKDIMKKITVFLADDHAIFREGLRLLLQADQEIEVVGEAANGHRTVAEVARLQPAVVLMDIAMSLLNGIDATRRITREVPASKVLILSSYSDDQRVQQSLEAGAAGYVMKETASQELFHAIREISKGTAFFSPLIAMRLLQRWKDRELPPTTRATQTLTDRQRDVVQLIAEGYSNKQMATLLCISIKTVDKHRQSLMDKLNIHEVATLTRYAVSHGVVEAEAYNHPIGDPAARRDGRSGYRLTADTTLQP
jgi:DNA-binding NarL/FixJ family response regulator